MTASPPTRIRDEALSLFQASPLRLSACTPFLHLGSRAAALQRAGERGAKWLHETAFQPGRAMEIRDRRMETYSVEGSSNGWSPISSIPEGHPAEGEAILGSAAIDRLLMDCRANRAKLPPSLAGGSAVAKALRRLGFESLRCVNAWEDNESISWILLNPSNTRIYTVFLSHKIANPCR